MEELIRTIISIIILFLAIPIGNYLALITKEELKIGKKWFNLIVLISLVLSVIFLFSRNDWLFFSFAFIALLTSRSLK